MHAVSRSTSGLGVVLLPTAAIACGAAVAASARIAVVLTLLAAGMLAILIRGRMLWWDLLFVALSGTVLFDYGFANVGVPVLGSLVPLVHVIAFVVLIGLFLVASQTSIRLPLDPFVLAAGFMVLAAARLAVDYGVWGALALRDFSLAVELSFLFTGFLALRLYGLDRWVRALSWLFLACLVYFSLYPWREELASLGPTVGLQHPVSLLGTFRGGAVMATIAMLFFALLRPYGRWSYALAAAFLPLIALHQSRGIYLSLPIVAVCIWRLARHARTREARRGLTVAFAIGAALVAVVMIAAPAGRLGPLTPTFVAAQLATLSGGEGPSAGTYESRAKWFRTTMDQTLETPVTVAVGVGLGPDLAGGILSYDGELIRKPHNDYLEIFARFGVLGLVLFLLLLASSLRTVARAIRAATEQEGRFLLWAIAVSVIVLLAAATQPVLAYTFGTMPLFLMLGAGLALAHEIAGRDRAEGEP